jgi:enediyne biosynthesis protein E4
MFSGIPRTQRLAWPDELGLGGQMRHRSILLAALAGVAATVAAYFVLVPGEENRPLPKGMAPVTLQPIEVPFQHRWDRDTAHPFLAAAAIDVDGDGDDEVFLGGSDGQPDALLMWQSDKLVDVAGIWGLGDGDATYGALSLDLTGNDHVDLLTVGHAGLTLWRNDGKSFKKQSMRLTLPNDSVPMAVTAGDFDRDGHVDLYVSVFVSPRKFRSPVFNDPEHAKKNLLLRNKGDLTFEDVTEKTGAGGLQNTFTSSFVDLNDDNWLDLVLAQNTGEVEILKNVEGKRFERAAYRSGFGFWMGLAFGDVDRDGDLDILLTNLGNSIPGAIVRGDRRSDQLPENDWKLLRNDRGFNFVDVTEKSQLTGFGFAWGAAFEDINFDGALDLLVAQNYIKWPVHKVFPLPGKVLLGAPVGRTKFFGTEAGSNSGFGHVPLIADLDGDGRNDIVWANMDGPAKAFLNRSPRDYISIRLPDTPDSIGARITVEGVEAPALVHVAGQGLTSDRTVQYTIGLRSKAEQPTALYVQWPNDRVTRVGSPRLNDTLLLRAPPN